MAHLFSDAKINIRITHTQSVDPLQSVTVKRCIVVLPLATPTQYSSSDKMEPGAVWQRGWQLIPGFRPSLLTEAQMLHTETCRWQTGKSIHSLRLRWWDAPPWDKPWLWFNSGDWEYYICILTGSFQPGHQFVQSVDHGHSCFVVFLPNMQSIHFYKNLNIWHCHVFTNIYFKNKYRLVSFVSKTFQRWFVSRSHYITYVHHVFLILCIFFPKPAKTKPSDNINSPKLMTCDVFVS